MLTAAAAIVQARRAGRGFSGYPGKEPASLAEAYAVQAEAVSLWGQPIAGWKVGRIGASEEQLHGENRFVGPIFAEDVWTISPSAPAAFPVIPDGSAAFEAELIARVDVPDAAMDVAWTKASVLPLVRCWHIGIEVAGSPLADIGSFGPLVSIAAFGNNLGLILGPTLPDATDVDTVACTSTIGGLEAGPAVAGALPGGPLEAIAFALNKLAALGQIMPGETLISTGAITGVHLVATDQECRAEFVPGGVIECRTRAVSSM